MAEDVQRELTPAALASLGPCSNRKLRGSRSPRSLAGKPLARFRATPFRRITVLCGMIVSVIRFKNPLWRRARVVCCCGAVRVQGRCAWDTGRLTHVDRALWLNPRVSRFTSQARPVETQSCVSTLTPQRTGYPYNSVPFQALKGRAGRQTMRYSHTHSHTRGTGTIQGSLTW